MRGGANACECHPRSVRDAERLRWLLGACFFVVFVGFCFWCAAHYSHDECYTSAFFAGMWGPPCDIANEITFKFIQRTFVPRALWHRADEHSIDIVDIGNRDAP